MSPEAAVPFDLAALDESEKRFWSGIWRAVPTPVAEERGIESRAFGPVQATVVADLPEARMLNLILGAAEPGAVEGGHLDAALDWAEAREVGCYVPVTPVPSSPRRLRRGAEPARPTRL
jgi:hypothetical protein